MYDIIKQLITDNLKDATTYTKKDYNKKWKSSTQIDLKGGYKLDIYTSNNSGVLTTRASVAWSDGTFKRHLIHADYSIRIKAHDVKRITSTKCEILHNDVLLNNDIMLDIAYSISEHYKDISKNIEFNNAMYEV